jgi:hypothetical protein
VNNVHGEQRSGRWDRRRFLIGFIATPVVLLTGCGAVVSTMSGAAPTANSGSGATTQTNDAGQVTVAVTWPGPAAGPVFAVTMNTHAVDLDGYDLLKLAVLTTNNGQSVQPISWDAPSGGHHRQGTLTFPTNATDGAPLIGPNTSSVKLIIRDVAGVPERTFQWTPPS